MTFVTSAARANLSTCFVPELANSTIKFATSMVRPLTGGKLASMIAFASITKCKLIMSGYWVVQGSTLTSEYIRQIIMSKIGDTYGFKSIIVFRVRSAERKYHLWFHYSKFATSTVRWPMALGDGTYPRTRYPASSRCSTICDPVYPDASVT